MEILLIDDNTDVLDIFGDIFKNEGYTVRTAIDGNRALSSYLDKKPDVIVVDIIIPGINGIDLVKKIRVADHKTPIIALSGYEEELTWAQRAGVDAVFLKPPKMEDLLKKLSDIKQELERKVA